MKPAPLKNKEFMCACCNDLVVKVKDKNAAIAWFEKELIKRKLWNKRCKVFAKDCPNCEFWKIKDKAFADVVEEKDAGS